MLGFGALGQFALGEGPSSIHPAAGASAGTATAAATGVAIHPGVGSSVGVATAAATGTEIAAAAGSSSGVATAAATGTETAAGVGSTAGSSEATAFSVALSIGVGNAAGSGTAAAIGDYANKVYPKFKQAMVSGGANVDLIAGRVKMALIDTAAYSYAAGHEFLSDIPAAARIAISLDLESKAISDLAAFQTGNGRFDGVIGAAGRAIVLFVDTGFPNSSRLVMFEDTWVPGLPVTPPAGASYNVIPNPQGWFFI